MRAQPKEKPPKLLKLVGKNEQRIHCGTLAKQSENGIVYCPKCGNPVAATTAWQIELLSIQPGTRTYNEARILLQRIVQ